MVAAGRELAARLIRPFRMDALAAALSGSPPAALPTTEPSPGRDPWALAYKAPGVVRGGCLKIVVDTGVALITIDRTPRGRTPYASRVAPGIHTVSARSLTKAYAPNRLVVSVRQSDTSRVVFRRATASSSP